MAAASSSHQRGCASLRMLRLAYCADGRSVALFESTTPTAAAAADQRLLQRQQTTALPPASAPVPSDASRHTSFVSPSESGLDAVTLRGRAPASQCAQNNVQRPSTAAAANATSAGSLPAGYPFPTPSPPLQGKQQLATLPSYVALLLEPGGGAVYAEGMAPPHTCLVSSVPTRLQPALHAMLGARAAMLMLSRDLHMHSVAAAVASAPASSCAPAGPATSLVLDIFNAHENAAHALQWADDSKAVASAWVRCALLHADPHVPGLELPEASRKAVPPADLFGGSLHDALVYIKEGLSPVRPHAARAPLPVVAYFTPRWLIYTTQCRPPHIAGFTRDAPVAAAPGAARWRAHGLAWHLLPHDSAATVDAGCQGSPSDATNTHTLLQDIELFDVDVVDSFLRFAHHERVSGVEVEQQPGSVHAAVRRLLILAGCAQHDTTQLGWRGVGRHACCGTPHATGCPGHVYPTAAPPAHIAAGAIRAAGLAGAQLAAAAPAALATMQLTLCDGSTQSRCTTREKDTSTATDGAISARNRSRASSLGAGADVMGHDASSQAGDASPHAQTTVHVQAPDQASMYIAVTRAMRKNQELLLRLGTTV